jgi:hypothetical protein
MNLTGTDIIEMLRTNDKAVCRALVVLFERQTEDEKASEHTRHENGRGFRPCHARMGTSMAKFYLSRGFLTQRQIAYWRREGKEGMRIAIYWKQLLDAAHRKAAAKQAVATQFRARLPGEDVGNYEESKMVWEEEREMQRMEAQGDRAQTILDEVRKHAARSSMEGRNA